jgi:hypothetical protein
VAKARSAYTSLGTESMSAGDYREIVTVLGGGSYRNGQAELAKLPDKDRKRLRL